mgnify:CR=1 FL=1
MPVQILGLNGAPEAGDSLVTVESDEKAKELCELRSQIRKNKLNPKKIMNIEVYYSYLMLSRNDFLQNMEDLMN